MSRQFDAKQEVLKAYPKPCEEMNADEFKAALAGLSEALDAFWNDPQRPSIAQMRGNTVQCLSAAQMRGRAALLAADKAGGESEVTETMIEAGKREAVARRMSMAWQDPEDIAAIYRAMRAAKE
jgi:hypothetical protein